MKTMNIITGLAILAGSCIEQGKLIAQTDTVRERIIVRDSAAQPRVIHDTVARREEAPPLRAGEFGVRFMPTVTSLSFNGSNGEVIQGSATVNYGYGVMFGANFTKNVGLQAEINYLDISQQYKDQNLDRQVHLNYINIPVMLSLNTDKTKPVNLNLVAGPQFGINVGSSVSSSGGSADTVQAVLAVKQGDVGIAYGAGLEFALNKRHTFRFDLGFRGMYGLVNINGTATGPNTYGILVDASRKTYGGYAGLTLVW